MWQVCLYLWQFRNPNLMRIRRFVYTFSTFLLNPTQALLFWFVIGPKSQTASSITLSSILTNSFLFFIFYCVTDKVARAHNRYLLLQNWTTTQAEREVLVYIWEKIIFCIFSSTKLHFLFANCQPIWLEFPFESSHA